VDDDATIRESLATLLQALGYSVSTFTSGQSFLGSDVIGETHCLVADIATPGMSGFDLQTELRGRGYDIPTVFMTAVADEVSHRTDLGSATVTILLKPLSEAALLRAIDAALG
jgi:FixJ family two-component response regulator